MTNDQYLLLKACSKVLNNVPNTRMYINGIYKDTYELVSAIDKELTTYEEFMTSAKVGEQYMNESEILHMKTTTSSEHWDNDEIERQTLKAYGFNDI